MLPTFETTMVHQTRKIVEDFLLYKIHTAFSNKKYILNGPKIDYEDGAATRKVYPLPQPIPSSLNLSLRDIAKQYEDKYKEMLESLINEFSSSDLSSNEVDRIFSKITKELFQLPLKHSCPTQEGPNKGNARSSNGNYTSAQNLELDDSHIKWGHVVTLLVFAGILAVRAVECRSPRIVDDIVSWITSFFDTELSQWLSKQGGWDNFPEWSKASETKSYTRDSDFNPDDFVAGFRSVMSVGVLAACLGLGALIITKK